MDELAAVELQCPYCGEDISLTIDCSVPSQEYTEDCSVCCQPMQVRVRIDEQGEISVEARRENE